MHTTLITIGNTHIRHCHHDGKNFGKVEKIKTNILKKPSCFGLSSDVDAICAVSVVPFATALLQEFADKNNIPLKIFSSNDYPFANLTDEANKVGADRLLAVMAAKQLGYQPPLVIIDIGTAITADFVDKDWGFEGGLIMPSPELMLSSLHQSTAQLPSIENKIENRIENGKTKKDGNEFIGKNTTDAMDKGAKLLANQAIKKIMEKANADDRRIILTGGGVDGVIDATIDDTIDATIDDTIAAEDKPAVAHEPNHEPDLLFHGLVYFNSLGS